VGRAGQLQIGVFPRDFCHSCRPPACPWNITDVKGRRAQLLLHGMNDGAYPAGPRAAFESNEHRWSSRRAVLLLVADLFSL
jgi:hypothetical protein